MENMEVPESLVSDESKASCKRESLGHTFEDSLIRDITALYMAPKYSDVILLVAEERIHAHKVVLASRNPYFSALLFGGLGESSKKEIELKDVDKETLPAFKILLKSIYGGIIPLEEFTPEVLLDVARLANLYNCIELEKVTIEFLFKSLNTDNVLGVYSLAADYRFEEAMHTCLTYMDEHAMGVLRHSEFNSLTKDCVIYFASRDSIVSDEFSIFQAVQSWIRANPDADATEMLNIVRLHLVPMEHIMTSVNPSGLYTSSSLMAAIQKKWEMGDTKLEYCRTGSLPDVNLTDEKNNAKVLLGQRTTSKHDLLRKISDSDAKEAHTLHEITGDQQDGILIDLGCQRMVNHFEMLLTDTTGERYCYYIEVSLDQKRWMRVVDHRRIYCFGLQNLYFESIIGQYIRIVGTECSHPEKDGIQYFRVNYFKAIFKNKIKKLSNGFLIPKKNVATLGRGARVTSSNPQQGVKALLEPASLTAKIKCGTRLEVQLPQPYVVNSIRFHLPDEHRHEYTVHVSRHKSYYFQVAEMRGCCNESSGWQNIQFKNPETVSTITITAHKVIRHGQQHYYGYNEDLMFQCQSFECPFIVKD